MSPAPQPPRRGSASPGRKPGAAPLRAPPPGAIAAQPVAVQRRRLPQFTTLSCVELGVAAVLFALSAALGWGAVRGYFAGMNLKNGIAHYASNQGEKALEELETASRWDPANPNPLLLLAKMKTDADALKDAEDNYQAVIRLGEARAGASYVAAAHVGLGVLWLKQAERQPGEALKKPLASAQAEFSAALKLDPESPETQIGLAHVSLLAGDAPGALARLNRVASAPGDRITRDGLPDLYLGTGVALRRTRAPVDGALRAYGQARALAPGLIWLHVDVMLL